MGRQINVSEIVDAQPLGLRVGLIAGLCFLATTADGYGLLGASLAAPGIIRDFHVSRAIIAPLFSIALFGMLLGALASGYLGDRYGRKRGLVVSLAIVALTSLACAAAQSFEQLVWIRFVMGLGVGGLLPHVTALMSEYMPRKVRGALTTYAFMGITVGGALVGVLSAEYFHSDWRTLFLVGGLLPLAVTPLAWLLLPESLKFLTLRPERWDELRGHLKKFSPDTVIGPDDVFVLTESTTRGSIATVFEGRRKWITPLLWLSFLCVMLVNFFINSWIVLVLLDIGYSPARAAAVASLYHVGGILGGLLMGVALDLGGPVFLVLFALLGCASAAVISVPDLSQALVAFLVGCVGFSVLGAQVGMSAIAGLIYPTAARSQGAGFAHAVGRIGAIMGPLIAGWQIAEKGNFFVLFLVPAIPLAVAALAFFFITWIWLGKPLGHRLASRSN